jgi:hypothetical protein
MDAPQRGGLFHHPKQEAPPSAQQNTVSEASRRLRMLEERYSNLERRFQVTEQNMLASDRRMNVELKTLATEMQELRATLAELKDRLRSMVNEIRQTARQEDLDVMKKYLSYWEPVNFVTQQQVERIVRRVLEEREDEQKV